ncbi:expressed unknown protein [Seminavis robusta]|uniref:Uncharacterized protein n=1 Tax=Seminavis robusta TaxID=568900 RepID=A0A9N8ED60_9STRA|nr:expressed unknown protein [Seminavis robusta]|eukprot:Sro904_g218430.1 n/a (327) ;mRNA; f:34463-35443
MKVGQEVNFLAGQIFMVGVAAVAVLPRVPSDTSSRSIGGRLSLPFRRALLFLAIVGLVRTLSCHLLLAHRSETMLLKVADAVLGTIQVVGQNFLCLTTAYILQCQLETVINIDGGSPGRSLMPFLMAIFVLTVAGSLLAAFVHPYWFFLVNMAEALSCRPVVKTLQTYAAVTTPQKSNNNDNNNRKPQGPILVQVLLVVEKWFLTTALLSCLAEFVAMGQHGDDVFLQEGDAGTGGVSFALQLLLQAIRTNQDNGIDDWTRLLLHSVFLNSIDELEHFTGGISSGPSTAAASDTNNSQGGSSSNNRESTTTTTTTLVPTMGLRQRG